MGSGKRFLPWITLIVLFIGFQAAFIALDNRPSAPRTAEEFIKAYYAMDPAMSDMVCKQLLADGAGDPTARFLYDVSNEAKALGHNLNYMRSQMMTFHASLVSEAENSAVIHITGTRKRCIHPVFTFLARLFFIGDTFAVDKTLNLVKEDGQWRVCNNLFTPIDVDDIYGHAI